MKLHGYFRSSAAFRVRIALNLKGLAYDQVAHHLRKGEQRAPEYLKLNPQGLVPALEDGANVITQSLAIIEYLEEVKPTPPLFPATPAERARVRAIALAIACEIHPLNNPRVLAYLKNEFKISRAQNDDWYRHWIAEGFGAIEQLLQSPATGRFCHGDHPGAADAFLIPQIFNALRYDFPLKRYPTINRIFETCMTFPAFDQARPENQPDAE